MMFLAEAPDSSTPIIIWVVIGLVIVAGIVLIIAKSRRKHSLLEQPSLAQDLPAVNPISQKDKSESNAKRCPTCHSTYTDQTLRYCLVDGTLLEKAIGSTEPYDLEATMQLSDKGSSRLAPTIKYQPEMNNDKDVG